MELSHKTTILLPPAVHRELARLARIRRKSIGQLIREAIRAQYGLASPEERVAAAEAADELAH